MTPRQWAQLGVTIAVAGAAIVGGMLTQSPTAPKLVPGASQPSAPAIQTPGLPTAHAVGAVAVDTVIQWIGVIAADSATGALRSDLGWRNGGQGAPGFHLAYCEVGTQTSPSFKRLLLSPEGSILWLTSNPASYTIVDCTRAFHTWDSLEGVSDGRWPKP